MINKYRQMLHIQNTMFSKRNQYCKPCCLIQVISNTITPLNKKLANSLILKYFAFTFLLFTK